MNETLFLCLVFTIAILALTLVELARRRNVLRIKKPPESDRPHHTDQSIEEGGKWPMYIVEFEQTTKKQSRGGAPVAGVNVSVYRVNKRIATPNQATAGQRKARVSELLGERFFQGDDCGVHLKRDAKNISIRIPDLPPRRKEESNP